MRLINCFVLVLLIVVLVGCGKQETAKESAPEAKNSGNVSQNTVRPESYKLSQLFESSKINIENIPLKDLDKDITSSDVFENDEYVGAAYYLVDEYIVEKYLLHVALYTKQTKILLNTQIDLSNPKRLEGFSASIGIRQGYVYISLHDNPSSYTTVIMDKDLKYLGDVYGGDAQVVGGSKILYTKSQVHFAPTHYAEVELLDTKTGKIRKIYPLKPYKKIRQKYIDQNTEILQKKLGEEWAREKNHYPDGELFDNCIRGEIVVNEGINALAFNAVFMRSNRYPQEIILEEEEVV